MRRTCAAFILGFWLVMTGLLLQREWGARQAAASPAGYAALFRSRLPQSLVQMGIYVQDERVGATRTKYDRRDGHYEVSSTTRLRLPFLGTDQLSSLVAVVELDGEFQLSRLSGALAFAPLRIDFEGLVVGRVLRVQFRNGPQVVLETTIPLEDQEFMANLFSPFLAAPQLAAGRSWPVRILNPLTQRFESALAVVEEQEFKTVGGRLQEVFRIRISSVALEMIAWATPDGEVVEQWIPRWHLKLVREDPDATGF